MTVDEAFDAWFEGSKAVDQAGKPIILYHGCQRRGPWRETTFLSASQDVAESFAHEHSSNKGSVYPVYLQMKNPLDARYHEGSLLLIQMVRDIPGLDIISDISYKDSGWGFECPDIALRYDRDPEDMSALMLFPEVRSLLASRGYDGVILSECVENTLVDTWVPLSPEQILVEGDEPPLPKPARRDAGDAPSP